MNKNQYIDCVVIGSGLSAMGAVKGLIKNGVKPLVISKTRRLENKNNLIKNRLKNSKNWSEEDKNFLLNLNQLKKSKIPKKEIFGSTYYYDSYEHFQDINLEDKIIPSSSAYGGLALGWGSAVLTPNKNEIKNWPVSYKTLLNSIQEALIDLPYSSGNEQISHFPNIKDSTYDIKISNFEKIFLSKIKSKSKFMKNVIIMKSRLLTGPSNYTNKCEYCGYCMSGCVYDSIFKPNFYFDYYLKKNKINLLNNTSVKLINKVGDFYKITCYVNGKKRVICSKKVFLAAGSFNSSKIIKSSFSEYKSRDIKIFSRGGIIAPIFSPSKINSVWPKKNTLPSIFLLFFEQKSKTWVHSQLSFENELFVKKFSNFDNQANFKEKIFKFIKNHVFIAQLGINSKFSGIYNLTNSEKTNEFLLSYNSKIFKNIFFYIKVSFKFFFIFLKFKTFPLLPFFKINFDSYHVGSSFPMSNKYKNLFSTNIYGELEKYKNLHIVDSSILPSIPGTTIGSIIIGNAFRIADSTSKVSNNKK